MIKLTQAGDTIVEVLISVTVLAFALGTGYATVSKSNQTMQANKERYQAQLVANQQVEYLRAWIHDNKARIITADTCIKDDVLKNGTAQCQFSDLNASTSAAGATYTVLISPVSALPSCVPTSTYCTYKIDVTWDSLKGGTERVVLYYGV